MTKVVANTIIQTDTFAGWLDKTNELATEIRTSIVTTANSANVQFTGANTTGNAFVVGVFGASALSMLGDSNSDAFVRVIPNGETDSANTSGNLVFQSETVFNANLYANSINVDIEGNVVSNGTNFDVTATLIELNGAVANVESTTTNFNGTDAVFYANVSSEAANVTFGNSAAATVMNIDQADLYVQSNATFQGSTLTVNASATFDTNTTFNETAIANTVDADTILVDTLSVGNSDIVGQSTTLDSSNATNETIESFAANTYYGAKIIVSGRHTNSTVTEVQSTEVLIVTDGTDVFMTTYGTLSTDVSNDFSVFDLDAEVSSGNVNLLANTGHANTKITVLSQLFKIQ